MSDLSSYRQQVTQYGQRAQEAETAKRYEEAYGHYMAALDVFMHLIKCKFSLTQWSCPFKLSLTASYWLFVLVVISSREEPATCQVVQGEDGIVPIAG